MRDPGHPAAVEQAARTRRGRVPAARQVQARIVPRRAETGARLARTGARDPAKTAVRPTPAEGPGVPARARARTTREGRRHARLDRVRWSGTPRAELPAAALRTAHAGTIGHRQNAAARVTAPGGHPARRAGPRTVTPPAIGEPPNLATAVPRRLAAPAGRVSLVCREPPAPATAARARPGHVRPALVRPEHDHQTTVHPACVHPGRVRPGLVRQSGVRPGGATARMPDAMAPEIAAHAPVLTVGQTARPAVGIA